MTTFNDGPLTARGNLADVVRIAADHDAPALFGAAGTRSWSELDDAVEIGVRDLGRRGYVPGDRLVLALDTGFELAAALFAALRAGIIAVPVSPTQPDVAAVIERAGARGIVIDKAAGDLATTAEKISQHDIAAWWQQSASDKTAPDTTGRVSGASGEDIALLARAGRAGPPVMLSHRALISAALAVHQAPAMALTQSDRVLQLLPLFHVVGLVTSFVPAALSSAAVVLVERPTGELDLTAAIELIDRERVTVLPAEPTLYRQLHRMPQFERALASVRLMTSGSSPLDASDLAAIRRATGQGVREGYGISESAAAVTSTLMCDAARPGSVGLPYASAEIAIVHGDDQAFDDNTDADDDSGPDEDNRPDDDNGSDEIGSDDGDIDVDAGDVGRIAVRGPMLFSGYWPDSDGGPDRDGWLLTTDIGFVDDLGELHLVDRADETVVIAGFTVYPREVEDVLATHPYVSDAAVVGVAGADGMEIVAMLLPKPATRPTAADLDTFVADKLAPFKRPARYRIVRSLPRTEVGRLDRSAVRSMLGTASDGQSAGRDCGSLRLAESASDVAPGLAELGRRLPAAQNRTRRSAQDTDSDMF